MSDIKISEFSLNLNETSVQNPLQGTLKFFCAKRVKKIPAYEIREREGGQEVVREQTETLGY